MTDLRSPEANGQWATAIDRQAAARQAYRQSITDGAPLTGAELGRRFNRSPRWGRDRVAEAQADSSSGTDRHATPALPETNGNHVSSDRLPSTTDASRNSTASTLRHVAPPPADASSPAASGAAVTSAVRRTTTLAVLAVATVAGAASYDHQRVLAELAGEGWRAWLLPLSVDGLIVAASMSMLVRRRSGQRAGALATTALALGVAVSVTANVAAADPTLVGRLVAAWPPVALLLSYELLMQQVKTSPRTQARWGGGADAGVGLVREGRHVP